MGEKTCAQLLELHYLWGVDKEVHKCVFYFLCCGICIHTLCFCRANCCLVIELLLDANCFKK